ncbi:GEVED domain-containing protein [Flavobacterium sp. 3HN19-14]|uniref:GEVED domain-containing protein n=1 Tax=Flavobacterium sp. 3HN19-14 TaxID=3448133 RepID=UPI003EE284B8
MTITSGAVTGIAIQGSQGGAGYTSPTVTIAPSSFGVTGDFSIIVNATPAPPANDNICTATSIVPAANCTPLAGNTFTATASPQAACGGVADDDVWYSFVAGDTNIITVQSGVGFNAYVELLSSSDNTCTGTLTSLSCVNNTTGGGIETISPTGLTPGNTYFVRVYNATSGTGSGNFTICITSPVPVCTTNSTPANLATGISMTPTFTWAAATYATNYDLYVGTASGAETLFANSLTTSYTVTTPALAASTLYYWYVVPKNTNGTAVCGVANETSFTTVSCSEPTNVLATNVTTSSADISWAASPSAPADGYQYEVRTSGAAGSGNTGLTASGTTNSLSVPLSSLAANTTYSIYVRSVCNLGSSLFSTWTSVVTFYTGYCVPTYTSGAGSGDEITNVTLGTLNNNSGASTTPYYTYYNALAAPVIGQGVTYPVSISFGTDGNQYAAVWIDFNHNLTFEASEGFISTVSAGASGTTVINVSVPLNAVPGITRMRVRGGNDTQLTTAQACGASSSGFGETEDYNVNISLSNNCSGTPDPGNTLSSAASVCSGANFSLSTQNTTTDFGISYQWESADDAGFTTNVTALGTNATQTTNQSSDKYYRVTVTCSNGGGIGVSTPVLVTMNPFYNCYPAVYASDPDDEDISNVTVGTLNNSSTCATVGGAGSVLGRYTNFTAVSAPNLEQLQSYNFSLTQTTCGGTFSNLFQIYIDFNHNGSFAEANEKVYTQPATVSGNQTITGSFVVPIDAVPGTTGMRIVNVEGGSAATNYATTAYTYGETEDYLVNIVATFACTGTPTPGNTLSTESATCAGSNFTLSAQNATSGSGVTYQWESADDAGFTTNVVALGTSPTQVTSQTTAKYYRVNVTCSGNTGTSNPIQVGVIQCTYDTAIAPATYTSIISTGTVLPGWQNLGTTAGDDNVSTTVSLAGTTFKYIGTSVTGFQMSSNGWATFNTANTSTAFTNSLVSTAQNKVLAPFWDDLVMTGTNFANRDSNFRYQISGTLGSGSAVITMEWAGLERFNNPGPNLNFQVKLYESDNHIEFIYGNFEGFDGTLTSAYSYSTGYNGTNPAGTSQLDRFALQTPNANHFSATTDPASHIIMPACNTMITFTPGVYTGLTSAPTVVAPGNDNSAGAFTLPVLGSPATSYCGTYYTSRGATNSAAGQACATTAGNEDDDVWFKFTTTSATDYVIKLRTSPNYDGVLQLLDASLAPITCVNATGAGAIETITATALTSGGTDYYVRVFHNGTTIGTSSGEFSLSVSEVISAPLNDNIGGAVPLTVNTTCSATASPQPSILAATASPQAVCGGTADDDVWYSFTATSTANTVTVQSGSGYNAYLQVFSSSDNTATGTLTSMTCTNATATAGVETYAVPFVQGNTYFIRIYHALAGTGSGNFTVCVTAPIPGCVASPTAPVNASSSCPSVTATTLSWAAVANASAYDVYFDMVDGTTLVSPDQAGLTYDAGVLAAGNYFWRVIPKSVNGAASACSTFTFTVNAPSVGGAVSGGTQVCSGSTSGLLTLSGHTGSIVRWESSVAPFTTWTPIANTTASYTSGALTQTTQFRAVIQNNGCATANSTATTVTISSTTWSSNAWSNGTPNATTGAVISGNYSSTGDLTACSLSVTSGTVTVNPGHDFVITNGVTVSGGSLTFENNANLIQTTAAANSGAITVKRNATMRRLDYVYWGSPVAGQDLKVFSPYTVSPINAPGYPTPTGASRFYTMDETTNSFAVVAAPLGTPFAPAKGYMLRAPNNFPTNGTQATFNGVFTGVPNNGDAAIGITFTPPAGKGFNMIGNPYPSTINADLFLQQNPGELYFWTHTNQDAPSGANYATYTTFGTASAAGGATPDGSIAIGQGFLLKTSASGTATFMNSMRTGNNSATFFRNANTEKHRIWLNLTNSVGLQNQILIGYMDGATNGADVSVDAKQIEGNINNIASMIGEEKFNIQARALPFADTDEIPMSFNALTAGDFTISLDHADGLFDITEGQDVFIKDNLTGLTHNIKESAYAFAAEAGTTTNRFSVVFQSTTLGVENPTFDANSIVIFKNDNVVNINSGSVTMAGVKIFDIRGRLIFEQKDINATTVALTNLRAEQEVLLVQITSTDNKVVTKKVVY